ncbi:MAG: tetratricopeptide repeat protein [Bacteroidetes bacterium]|nr:tetratricopeptide repeat protein [Bacteroidota bacterium]
MAIVLITTFEIYSKVLKFDFLLNWDDYLYVTENSHVKDLSWSNIQLFFTNYYANNYQPVTMLFYAVEYKIGAGNASLFHFTNILFHLLNTYLVFILIRRISPKNAIVALITAAFFAVHPMHVESVAWVSELKDVLYSFFFLVSLIMYIRYLASQKIKHLAYVLLFFVLSCLSKSAAVILPLVMLLLDYYSGRKFGWKLIVEKLPFFIVSLIFGIVALNSQKGAVQDLAPVLSVIEHVSVVAFSFMNYLFKAVVPVNLSAIYPYPAELGSLLPVIYYLSILFIAVLLFFVWYSRRWGKDSIFGFLFFILTIILVLQIIPVGGTSMAERYTYIPYIGLFFIAGKLYEYVSDKFNAGNRKYDNYLLALFLIGFIIFSIVSFDRVKVWEDGDLLFSDVVNKYPESSISYRVRGDHYMCYYTKKTDVDDKPTRALYLNKSISDFEKSLTFPLNDYDKDRVNYSLQIAYNNRAYEEYVSKDYEGALKDYSREIEMNPADANAYYNRGSIKKEIRDYTGAINDFDKVISIDPNYYKAYNNRGNVKSLLKDYEAAIEDYTKAIELNPQYADAIRNRERAQSFLKKSKK